MEFPYVGNSTYTPNSRNVTLDSSEPNKGAAVYLNESYRRIFESMYGRLVAQTHLSDLYDQIVYVWNEDKQYFQIDLAAVTADLQTALANDPGQGQEALGEIARSLRGIGLRPQEDYLGFRETFNINRIQLGLFS